MFKIVKEPSSNKKPIQTSKKITWVFIIIYIFAIFCAAIASIKNHDIQFILDYLHQIVIIIVISYFSTKTVENVQKIRINPQFHTEQNIVEEEKKEDFI